jgi:lipoprotein-releasing system ATP-binding protein
MKIVMSSTAPKIPSPPAARNAAILVASGIKKSFRMGDTDLEILKRVDLTVRAGEFVAIEGRSGSGKSTLLHILGALDECNGGTISFEDRDIAKLSSATRAALRNSQFGFVFQFYHLLPELNVLENTLLPLMVSHSLLGYQSEQSSLKNRAKELLAKVGLEHRLRHRPGHLSGGERQRVAIARALMNQPRVLFADEPTGNLDNETGRQIMALLERLHEQNGQTIIMVTHDRSLACKADRVLVLESGILRPAEN